MYVFGLLTFDLIAYESLVWSIKLLYLAQQSVIPYFHKAKEALKIAQHHIYNFPLSKHRQVS